jgi:HPt (histidine-containing phosphotransfer) domain-containing protein
MTADAMDGAQEKCTAAGMNDYVAKPIDARQLFTVLARWTLDRPSVVSGGDQTDTTDAASDQTPAPFKLPGIDVSEALHRIGGDQDLYLELLQDFCESNLDVETQLAKLLDSGDMPAACRLAHTIKGTAGNLSAVSIQSAATELEKGLKDDDLDRLPELISNFMEAMKQLQRSLESIETGPSEG